MSVVLSRLRIAGEPRRHVAVRDDARRVLAVHEKRFEPKRVIDVPVRVDRRVHGRAGLHAQQTCDTWRQALHAGGYEG